VAASATERKAVAVLRAAWAIAYSDAFASYICAVFREPSSDGRARLLPDLTLRRAPRIAVTGLIAAA
jgi:hypothetical protein